MCQAAYSMSSKIDVPESLHEDELDLVTLHHILARVYAYVTLTGMAEQGIPLICACSFYSSESNVAIRALFRRSRHDSLPDPLLYLQGSSIRMAHLFPRSSQDTLNTASIGAETKESLPPFGSSLQRTIGSRHV